MGVRENECQISQELWKQNNNNNNNNNNKKTGKILKNWCARCNFVIFDIHFLRLPYEIFFGVITDH